jgi:hypothetical protein
MRMTTGFHGTRGGEFVLSTCWHLLIKVLKFLPHPGLDAAFRGSGSVM